MSMQIRRDDLAQAVRDACGSISQQDSVKAISAVFDTIQASLQNGNNVVVHHFGTFSTTEHAARMGRNVRTGEPIQISARRVPKFKASKGFLGE